VSEPAAFLARNQNDRNDLAKHVRSFVLASPEALAVSVRMIRLGNVLQREAIGYGLGLAASFCAGRDPDLSRRIEDAVRNAGGREVVTAFRSGATVATADLPAFRICRWSRAALPGTVA